MLDYSREQLESMLRAVEEVVESAEQALERDPSNETVKELLAKFKGQKERFERSLEGRE